MTYEWKTLSVPLVVSAKDAQAIQREAELQRERDRRSIRETLGYLEAVMKKSKPKGGKKKGGGY